MNKTALLGVACFLALWYCVSGLGLVNPVLFPMPHVVAIKMAELVYTGRAISDVVGTVYRTAIGFAAAAIIGIGLGLVTGYLKSVYGALNFLIDFFRSIPATALFPMFMLFVGIGDLAKVSVVIFSCGLINMVHAAYGVRNARQSRILAARSMRATKWQTFGKVIFPEAMPHVFAGLRTTLSLSLVLVVVMEMFIGTQAGLGQRIYEAHLMFRIPEMYATIGIAGILGYLMNKGFVLCERKLVHWAGK
jgi:NitT/TauT family transport system permease protein